MAKDKSFIPGELISPSDAFIQASERIGLHWWHWDNEIKKISISPGLARLLGFGTGVIDLSEPDLYDNIHPEDIAVNRDRIRALIYGEASLYEMEIRLKDANGQWQWYYNRGTLIKKDAQGKGVLVGGITMDISGQFRQMMAKLDEQEKFEYIFRNTHEAILTLEMKNGRAGRLVDANKAALELFDKGPEDLNKFMDKAFVNDKLIGEKGLLFRQVLENGRGRVEKKMKVSKGRELWLEFSAHAFNRTGQNLVVVIVSDKTGKKRTEAALRESEKLYRTLFDAADDPIGLFTVDREFILINKAFHSTFGFEYEEFMNQDWMEIIHPDDRVVLEAKTEEFIKEGTLSVDYRCRHKSGHYLHVFSKSVIIRGDPGEKDLVLTIIRDVTERRRAMEELEKAKQKAEESDRLKSAFLANMSHEIRTPMNSIVGFSNLLANPDLENEARSLYISRIVKNSELLLALISDIIDLAKIESGQLPLILGKQRLRAFMADTKLYASEELSRLGREGLSLEIEEECGEFEIETDVIRLSQILRNLVSNAIKFTEEGSVVIGCKPSESKGKVLLYVRDTGIGIAPEYFDLIFEQFRQIDGSNTRRFGGTGLGLAICKNLVKLMGGRIWVESAEGEGALFQIELPLRASRIKFEYVREQNQKYSKGKGRENLSIIVVDDEEDSVELFSEILQGLGHHVISAPSGYEALRKLEKLAPPDLVFMDVQMPILSGTDTMLIMKKRFKGIRVVAQSAHALVGDSARFMEEGFDGYLAKPFAEEQICKILNELS